MFKLILVTFLVLTSSIAFAACPPIDSAALWLPQEHNYAKTAFMAKAKRLNDSGQCVVEGSFGKTYKKYYITVSPTGTPINAKILRFTYKELLKK